MLLGHVFRRWPFTQAGDDVLAQAVGQLAVKGFWTEEANGALVRDGRTGIGCLGVVEGHVGPVRVFVVHDGPHLKGLCHNEFEIEEAAAVNALPTEHEGAIVEFVREFGQQFIAHAGHGRGVVGPARAVFHRRASVFDLGVKGFTLQRFFEEQLGQTNTVGEHRRDDKRSEEDTGDHGQTALPPTPGTLSGETE